MKPKKIYAVVHEKTVNDNICDVTISDAYVSRKDAEKKAAELKSQVINEWKSRVASTYKVDDGEIFNIYEMGGGNVEWIHIHEMQIISNKDE